MGEAAAVTEKKKLVILTGPTAVGKTALSLKLAGRIGGEIISADSMQVYRGMDIGSAKATPQERALIPHHLIDLLDPSEEFHVVRFQEEARRAIEDIASRGKIPIMTGGTGFYIQAVLYDIDFTEAAEDAQYRQMLEEKARTEGNEALHAMLAEADPASAAAIHANNVKRVIRALEYYHETGNRISEHNEAERQRKSPYCSAYFVLNDERSRVYERINRRVDEMMKQGLPEEVDGLRRKGYTRDLVSMQGLGYKELLAYFDGEMSLEEAVDTIKRDTRHFAKRQLTWFRRERDVIWVDKNSFGYDDEKILDYMMEILKQKGIL